MRTAFALAVMTTFVASSASAKKIKWEPVTEEEGIRVWQRAVPGTSLVEFRGRGIVKENYQNILAVLANFDRKTEWMESCVGSHLIEALGPGRSVMYNRTGSKFPLVSDRDVVMESKVDVDSAKRRISIDVWSVEHKKMPPVDDVVRMPNLRARWILEVKGPQETRVTYQVRADPGGALPHWVVNLAAKKMPLHTLRNLRQQAKKDGYDKERAEVASSFDWSGFTVEGASARN